MNSNERNQIYETTFHVLILESVNYILNKEIEVKNKIIVFILFKHRK